MAGFPEDSRRHTIRTERPARVSLAAYAFPVPELSGEELDALVEEATVDAYGDDERLAGIAVMIEENLKVPVKTTAGGL